MKKVNNKRVIRRIADQTRKAGKKRNLIAVLAIALTALLFTTVFTVGGSLLEKSQEETMRQVGGSAHGGYKYLTQEEYDILKKDQHLTGVSYRIMVGDLVNEKVKKLPTEVNYYEEQDAKWGFCYPQVGHMPEKENEFVASDLVLKALGVSCRLGEQVPLEIQIGEDMVKRTFTLSGYYQGDSVMMAQMVMVSKDFQEKVAPVPTESMLNGELMSMDMYTGRIMADFNFRTSLFLEKQIQALSRRCGFGETQNYGVNWAYLGRDLDMESVAMMLVLLFVILVSGYLIIYNIFYINVIRDISYYGLLKTIGTTGKQLRQIVRRQALMLSVWGIPIGLLGGILVGNLLLPVIMNSMVYASSINQQVVWKGWIFAGAALFSFVTVYISCIKPCRVVSRVSAIEAVRYTEGQDRRQGRFSRKAAKKRKKTKPVTPFAMAVQNVGRNRKRVFIVVASLSLALVLLNCVYSILQGVSIDQFISTLAVTDFSVADASLDNFSQISNNTAGVTAEFLDAVKEQPGITEFGNIYVKELYPKFVDADWQKIEERILDSPDIQQQLAQYIPPDEPDYMEMVRADRFIDGNTYGISQLLMDSLEGVEGKLDWKKFQTGKYVITTRFGDPEEADNGIDFFLPGETITIYNEQGESRQYEVMAVANIPYACGMKVFGMFNCDYLLPEEEFLDFMGEQQPMRTLFNVDPAQEQQMQQWLTAYCQNVNPDLKCTSKESVKREYDSYKNMIFIVGNLLCLTLACIGILNFINTMVTSVLSRKQEFAMMEAVGMTGKQLCQMLCMEGGCYAVLTAIVSLILSSLLSTGLIRSVELVFFRYQFTLFPVILCLPFLFLVVLAVPALCYRNMSRISVVERMVTTE